MKFTIITANPAAQSRNTAPGSTPIVAVNRTLQIGVVKKGVANSRSVTMLKTLPNSSLGTHLDTMDRVSTVMTVPNICTPAARYICHQETAKARMR